MVRPASSLLNRVFQRAGLSPQQINGYLKHGLGAVLGSRAVNHGKEGVKMHSVAFSP